MYKYIILALFIILIGCESTSQKNSNNIRQIEPSNLVAIPSDVKYEIINSSVIPGIKRTLNLRLNQKVSKEVLRSIAYQLKNMDQNEYERTFILYYLPNMKVGTGAWATTHFDPDLQVVIHGISIEEEKNLATKSEKTSRKIIGNWLDESPGLPSKITIYFENGKYFMQNTYHDGSSSIQEIVKKSSAHGQRFERIKYSKSGDHYLIDSEGNLQIRDRDGLIATAYKVD